MKKFRSFLTASSVAVASLPALVFAEDPTFTPITVTPTEMVDPSGLATSLMTLVGGWVGLGLLVGISLFVVYVGWRVMRRFIK